ncbi:hypothetical protein B296_00008257 [Ensete ventricosum]|uniref:Uncharacterized protein n=1 Tax=Ensete ventricosum TaxID=4639 RepID=A0A427AND7_ENSVE|nr:hypothetical protein B296_00008257 [Ensete ventricosum]
MAVDGYVAERGGISSHDNMAGKGRRGQQRGDVGEGDLDGRGQKKQRWQAGVAAVAKGDGAVGSSCSREEGRWRECSGIGEKAEEAAVEATGSSGGGSSNDRERQRRGWVALEIKGGGWAATFNRTAKRRRGQRSGKQVQSKAEEVAGKQRQQDGDDDSSRGDREGSSMGLTVGNSGRQWGGEEEGAKVMWLRGYVEKGVAGRQQR